MLRPSRVLLRAGFFHTADRLLQPIFTFGAVSTATAYPRLKLNIVKEGEPGYDTARDLLQEARDYPAPSEWDCEPVDRYWRARRLQEKMGYDEYPFSEPKPLAYQLPKRRYKPHPWWANLEGGKERERGWTEGFNPTVGNWTRHRLDAWRDELQEEGWSVCYRRFMQFGEDWYFCRGRKWLVGTDNSGNKYWQSEAIEPKSRIMESAQGNYFAADENDATPMWNMWLRGIAQLPQNEVYAARGLPFMNYDFADKTQGRWFRGPHYKHTVSSDHFVNAATPMPFNANYDHWELRRGAQNRCNCRTFRPEHPQEFWPIPPAPNTTISKQLRFRTKMHMGVGAISPAWNFDLEDML
eukprot:TRINITY_DN66355_c8_g1_i1.p1 TRINITY_DN66355_c8_g1~~TRINITY_DN66355_c8_g1_i1.p1  ORF type:complete len:353 (+),score=10.84 TRINITY_DN66355_c8_g1_i1:35-1093(+)